MRIQSAYLAVPSEQRILQRVAGLLYSIIETAISDRKLDFSKMKQREMGSGESKGEGEGARLDETFIEGS